MMVSFAAIALAAACGCASETPHALRRTFDACAPLRLTSDAASALRADAIARGMGMWNTLAATRLEAGPEGPAPGSAGDAAALPVAPAVVPLRFQSAAPPFHGLYDDDAAVIYINDDLDGNPPALAITIAHEVGHAFGLLHVPPEARASLMNPGNLTVEPTAAD